MRPSVVLRAAQLRMVRGSAEDPVDLDLPTPGCAAAQSWRSATLNVCTRLQVGERQMPQFQLVHSLVAVYLAADGEAHVPSQISNNQQTRDESACRAFFDFQVAIQEVTAAHASCQHVLRVARACVINGRRCRGLRRPFWSSNTSLVVSVELLRTYPRQKIQMSARTVTQHTSALC